MTKTGDIEKLLKQHLDGFSQNWSYIYYLGLLVCACVFTLCVCVFVFFYRPFELVLEPDRDLFHENFTLKYDEVPVDQYQIKSFMYSGTVAGQHVVGGGGEGRGMKKGKSSNL